MRNLLLLGLLGAAFISCEKEPMDIVTVVDKPDDVVVVTPPSNTNTSTNGNTTTSSSYTVKSISAVQQSSSGKGDNGFSVMINDERIDATFKWEQFCTGNNGCTNADGTVSVFRVYTIEQSNTLGFDSFNITVKFYPPNAANSEFTFAQAELNFTTSTGLFQVFTIGTNLKIEGEDGIYEGKGVIGTNTFTDQTGEIDLSWTMNVSQGVDDEYSDNVEGPVVVTCDNVHNTLSAGAVGEEFIINEVNCTMVAFDGVIIHRGDNFVLGTQGFFDIKATLQPVIFKGFSTAEIDQIKQQMNDTQLVHFESN